MHVACQGVKVVVVGWIVAVVVTAWSGLALAAAVVIARVVRLRDRQVPVDRPVPGLPRPRPAADPAVERERERG